MDLSIVILNWKVKELLRQCLLSVYRYTNGLDFEVIAVDNDSRDGSVEMVMKEFPQAQVIANNRNLGFAAGNNPGIEAARGEFVLLLNPDTELMDNAFEAMVRVMRANPDVAVLGPTLLNTDRSLQPSVRGFPTPLSQVLVMLKLHNFFPRLKPVMEYFSSGFDYLAPSSVDQVMGAAFMVRRSVFEKLGLLDERFFIWFEEVDFCRRAVDAGYGVMYTPKARIVHHGGESFGQVFGPKRQHYLNSSLLKYMRKHFGLVAAIGLAILYPASMTLAWLAEFFGLSGTGRR
ncbi:MAG: glycosyltransferase family 2 protein [Patescibacteria group bacterium]|nr:glycosyltransferase family 2 protein [Patescibacteria group bacterium]